MKWLLIVFPNKLKRNLGKIFAEHGFRYWAAKQLGDFDCAFIEGSPAKVNAVGMAIVDFKSNCPWLEKAIMMVDEKGWL